MTPACTVTSMSSGLTRRILSICVTSIEMPPCSAATWPSSEVPVPNGIMGTPWPAQILTIAATSSVDCAKATASGGKPWW